MYSNLANCKTILSISLMIWLISQYDAFITYLWSKCISLNKNRSSQERYENWQRVIKMPIKSRVPHWVHFIRCLYTHKSTRICSSFSKTFAPRINSVLNSLDLFKRNASMTKQTLTLSVFWDRLWRINCTFMNADKIQFETMGAVEAHSPRGSSLACRTSSFSACAAIQSNCRYYSRCRFRST